MILSLQEYKNKVLGCWIGKNIGGTLGAPFEGKRGVFDVNFYTQDIGGEPAPNDDLDLQLVWLNAVEKYGRKVDSAILGEYWHTYIMPNWGEYGAGKNNLRIGLLPPLSGYVNNEYRNSCGAFIRSEIWACLAPGHPEIAVQYAYEDGIVDHSEEGVYAEIFCAAVQSAAFAESDKWRLIDIGLSYIPKDCGVTKGIKTAIESYKNGVSWKEARKNVLTAVPGSFGMLMTHPEEADKEVPVGDMGYDAPSNVAIMIIGWLYGEDNFGDSICITTNCGEDADCTAATLGATLGIILGADSIPKKWSGPIGNKIKTISLNVGDSNTKFPSTVNELTERVLKLTPIFLGSKICDVLNCEGGYTINMLEKDKLLNRPVRINAWANRDFTNMLKLQPFCVKHDFTLFNTKLDYMGEPYIEEGVAKKLRLNIENNIYMQQWINIKWHVPEGWEVFPGQQRTISLEQYHCNVGNTNIEFNIVANNLKQDRYDLVIELTSKGRHSKGFIPVVLIVK